MLRAILTILALVLALPAFAQPATEPPHRPRIGLVLGGGGARGFAHVGILQVLEENRIPVDAIAGTSMGAVVGSLYASGKNAQQLTAITEEIPWTTVFNDNIPRERQPFRRKRDERDVLIDYRVSFDNQGLVLPKGVLRGQELFLTLAEYLAPARGVEDFDRLAIPYRAVATDIETGSAVVLGSGDIATAVFASMSVPGGLPPVEREGKLLVDGGVVDNVPVDVARSMGVDILIVVDVGTPLRTRAQITSFVAVLDQMQLLLGRDNVKRQIDSMGPRDILIRPDLEGISTTAFDRGTLGIERGRAAAEAAVPQLSALSLSEAEWEAYLAARSARAPHSAPTLDFVKIVNNSAIPNEKIAEMVSAQVGQPLDARQMTKDLQDIYALGGFRSVRYGIGPADTPTSAGIGPPEIATTAASVAPVAGQPLGEGVTIRTEGDPTSANWAQFGLGITTDFNRTSVIRIGAAYTDRNFLGTGAEWRTDLRVGTNLLFQTGLYREWGRFFGEITPYWSRTDTNLYIDGDAAMEVRDARAGVQLDTGYLIGNWGELRVGLNIAAVDLDIIVGAPLFGDLDSQRDVSWRSQFTADKLDSLDFPTRGIYAITAYTDHTSLFGGDLDYNTFTAKVQKPISWGRNTLLLGGEIGLTTDGEGRSLADFRLGGFLNLSGLYPDELIGRHKMLGRAIFYHRLSEVAPIINVPLYLGGSIEVGNTWVALDDVSLGNLRPAGSLFVGADTPLGPAFIAGGLARGNGALYLILGRVF